MGHGGVLGTLGVARLVIVGALVILLPSRASAQAGGIAGTVTDSTGALLPGVTVEAASPALIEKVRSVVTDGSGQYKIIDLRPGLYSVTFSLAGFRTMKREGLELTAGFTASANAQLQVGALEETISVTSASPVVDVQNTRTQRVLSHEMLDELPTNKTNNGVAALIVGATLSSLRGQDVGGNTGETNLNSWQIHGSLAQDAWYLTEGFPQYFTMEATGTGSRHMHPNQVSIHETTYVIGGGSAEYMTGGPQINLVPKDGGNRYSFYGLASAAGSGFQSDNVTPELRAQGLTGVARIRKVYNTGVGIGGPIKPDKLWFYVPAAWWASDQYQPANYFNATPHTSTFTPDLSRQAFQQWLDKSYGARVTWQASSKARVTGMFELQNNCYCYFATDGSQGVRAPEASNIHRLFPQLLAQGTWAYPKTNRLLLESGISGVYDHVSIAPPPETSFSDTSWLELSTGIRYGGRFEFVTVPTEPTIEGQPNHNHNLNGRFSMSYVTGTHAFKAGGMLLVAERLTGVRHIGGEVRMEFLRGVPAQITQAAGPNFFRARIWPMTALFAQDQWTVRRLTLNLGVRFDALRGKGMSDTVEAGPFVPERTYAEVTDIPNWKDVVPRLGAAYDVFGNGRTAIKATLGKYVANEQGILTVNAMPANSIVGLATRTWTDPNPVIVNGYPVVNCDLRNFGANGVCGALNNTRFGTVNFTNRYGPDAVTGFGTRPYGWQTSATVQHEIRSNMSLNAGYFRTWYAGFFAQQNTAVTAANFDPFCITTPADARLPGGGGQGICGLYDVTPSLFGQISNLVTRGSDFGKQTDTYNGIDVALNAKFGRGGLLAGGVSTGRQVTDNCYVNNLPQVNPASVASGSSGFVAAFVGTAATPRTDSFCHITPPWGALTQFKVNCVYPLPWWDLQTSVVYQNVSGPAITATYPASNAAIAPSLGRNLAACGTRVPCTAIVGIPIIPSNSMFGDRLNQVDLRLTKNVRVGRGKIQGYVDLYNALNASTVLAFNTTYGPSWLTPLQILGGRLVKFGTRIDF